MSSSERPLVNCHRSRPWGGRAGGSGPSTRRPFTCAFGCNCPDGLLYRDVTIPPSELAAFIAEPEAANYCRVGWDNLHDKLPGGRAQLLLCHESDIHLRAEGTGL